MRRLSVLSNQICVIDDEGFNWILPLYWYRLGMVAAAFHGFNRRPDNGMLQCSILVAAVSYRQPHSNPVLLDGGQCSLAFTHTTGDENLAARPSQATAPPRRIRRGQTRKLCTFGCFSRSCSHKPCKEIRVRTCFS
ncbi:hypothetical protein AVEN_26622-1 [Araneus ventricosus]|uniref:Uncharacterized protein n=1 Tax=Araneus ventricosus TaxID=182803 RepID=A0A4Y2X2K8_ARAVE|nr:hypothetical protein AVEN_26622-1 [Araneus ventricosus]